MAKGTPVEAIPRDEIPEALGEIQWAVLQKTAKQTLGLNPIQKRAALESAIQVELGRAEPEPEPVLDPVGDTGEAGDAGIPEPPPVPQFDASALADLTKGEAPPEDPLPVAPPTAPEPEPTPVAAPVRPPVAATSDPGTWVDDETAGVLPTPYTGERFPEPPVNYLSRHAKLRIQIASGGQGRIDSEGIWHEPRRAKALQFGPEGGNKLFQCRAETRERVKAMETSKKFTTGLVWRERDEALKQVADAERHLAIVKAQASGDQATLAELLATQPQVIEGSRSTRNEPSPEGTPEGLATGPFVGTAALLNNPGRAGMAFRDGIRIAQARGDI